MTWEEKRKERVYHEPAEVKRYKELHKKNKSTRDIVDGIRTGDYISINKAIKGKGNTIVYRIIEGEVIFRNKFYFTIQVKPWDRQTVSINDLMLPTHKIQKINEEAVFGEKL